MRVIRVIHKGNTFYAAIQDQGLLCLNQNLGYTEHIPLEETVVVPPVTPTKIVCVRNNYTSRIKDAGVSTPARPQMFLKPPSAVIGNGQPIVLPEGMDQARVEGELALVVGKPCKGIAPDDAAEFLFGYACAADVATPSDTDNGDLLLSKGYDTFCPIGPWIETDVPNPDELTVRTLVDETEAQNGSTSEMVFKPAELLSYVSGIMTLQPGDVILTGSPKGYGSIEAGCEVKVEIDPVGLLIIPVVDASLQSSQPLH